MNDTRKTSKEVAGISADIISHTLTAIANKEMWCRVVECKACGKVWSAAGYYNRQDDLECPKCGKMAGRPILNKYERAVDMMVSALVDELGLPAKDMLELLYLFFEGDIAQYIAQNEHEAILKVINEFDYSFQGDREGVKDRLVTE